MTGCATAYWLHKCYQARGLSVVLLDARSCAGGATGRNGGHLWANPASPFEVETTAEILEFIRTMGVNCDLTEGGAAALARAQSESGVEYADVPDDPEQRDDDEDWGDAPTWDASECSTALQSDAFCHATVYPKAAQFYPAKVAAALLQSAESVAFCAPVRVLAIESVQHVTDGARGEPGQMLRWALDGDHAAEGVLRCRQVACCTNGWGGELLPELSAYLYPTRNQVLMTKPLPETASWRVGAFSVDSDIGARELYAIRRPDGRVCIGGARALEPGAAVGSTDDASLSSVVGQYLRRFLDERFPSLGPIEVEAEWTGVLGFTPDDKPLVGPLPGRPGVHIAAGFNGHGVRADDSTMSPP